MNAIRDEITIRATAREVYDALTRQAGYRGWWNQVAEVADSVGGEARLRFVKDGKPVNMHYRIDELVPEQSVRWTCVDHDLGDWIGTTLTWGIRPAGGSVLVTLAHEGWKGDAPAPVAQGWRHFLGSLRSYLETGTGQPW